MFSHPIDNRFAMRVHCFHILMTTRLQWEYTDAITSWRQQVCTESTLMFSHPNDNRFALRVHWCSHIPKTQQSQVNMSKQTWKPKRSCSSQNLAWGRKAVNTFLTSQFSGVAFHESSTLVCQFLLLGQYIETSMLKSLLPLVLVSKRFTSLL